MNNLSFKGAIPPMITPFKADGRLDLDAHIHNLGKWNEVDLGGYLVLGSNSETAYLSEQEKLHLIEATVQHAAEGRPVIAGTGLESTLETIRFTNKAAALGAQAALLLTPFYYKGKMNETAIIHHFLTVADDSDIPIMLYNVTKFTGINVSSRVVTEISVHPNIIGMKDSSGNIGQLIHFQKAAQHDFQVLTGTASIWYPALTLGVTAAVMALANCAPKECAQIQRYYEAGQLDQAKALYRRMVPLNTAITATFGIAGLKHVCDAVGLRGGYVRSPLSELTVEEKRALDDIVKTAGIA
jgi:4-hydroxy-2-oxoglutarate aldolase